jgi:hypothetical protein
MGITLYILPIICGVHLFFQDMTPNEIQFISLELLNYWTQSNLERKVIFQTDQTQ